MNQLFRTNPRICNHIPVVGLPKMCWGKWSKNLLKVLKWCATWGGVELSCKTSKNILRDSFVAEKVLCSVSFREKFVYLADSRKGER